MTKKLYSILRASLSTLAIGVGAAALMASPASAQTCYDFESLATGTTYVVGDVINTPTSVEVLNQFQWANGVWTSGGQATIVASNNAAGSVSHELNLNNINVHVFPFTPAAEVRFRYADLGGNVNLAVNGAFVNVGNLSALNGATLGGCQITVIAVAGPSGEIGRVVITPVAAAAVTTVGVGGQEFYLDDFCHD